VKNKNLVIAIVAGVILLIGISSFFVFGNRTTLTPVTQIPPEDTITVMKSEEIGLSLTITEDNKEVVMEVAKTDNIKGLDYELSYKSKGDIPRGVIGHIDIKQPGKEISQTITLGTCSDVCHYDEDVANIKLMVKIAKTDGTIAQVEKALN